MVITSKLPGAMHNYKKQQEGHIQHLFVSHVILLITFFFMPPMGTYWLGLVRACVCVCASVRSKKNQARVLKFHIWIPRQKIAYPYFFFLSELSPLVEFCPLLRAKSANL